ncbi:esterase/lipase family protein [Streptomyces prasinus]
MAFVAPLPFGYATSLVSPNPLRRIPTFDTVADSLKEFLETEAEGFRRLVLVGHGQGGLVAQRYLARMLGAGRGRELAQIRRIVLFACPNSGSGIGLNLRRR